MDCLGFYDCGINLLHTWGPCLGILAVCAGYIVLLFIVRIFWIYKRNDMHLRAYADMVECRAPAEQDNPSNLTQTEKEIIKNISKLLANARKQIPDDRNNPKRESAATGKTDARAPGNTYKCSQRLFGRMGRQLAAWRLVHDADRIATDLWPKDHIEAYALIAKEELKSLGSETGKSLAEQISKVLESNDHASLKALIKEARGLLFDAKDCYYEDLADWQNKAVWLVFVTSIILFLVAVTQINDMLLLLGAVGGLLARLRKTLTTKKLGFDYGVSWSILFLAPVVGALTGWVGVLLATIFINANTLGVNASHLDWNTIAGNNAGMVLAIAFGYSATLFDRVMEGAETALTKKTANTGTSSSNK